MNNNKSSLFLVLIPLLGGTALKAPFGCCDADPDMYPRYPTKVAPTPLTASETRQIEAKKRVETAKRISEEKGQLEEAERQEWAQTMGAAKKFMGNCKIHDFGRLGVFFCYCEYKTPHACKLTTHKGQYLPNDHSGCQGGYFVSPNGASAVRRHYDDLGSLVESPELTIVSELKAHILLKNRYLEICKRGIRSPEDGRLHALYTEFTDVYEDRITTLSALQRLFATKR